MYHGTCTQDRQDRRQVPLKRPFAQIPRVVVVKQVETFVQLVTFRTTREHCNATGLESG